MLCLVPWVETHGYKYCAPTERVSYNNFPCSAPISSTAARLNVERPRVKFALSLSNGSGHPGAFCFRHQSPRIPLRRSEIFVAPGFNRGLKFVNKVKLRRSDIFSTGPARRMNNMSLLVCHLTQIVLYCESIKPQKTKCSGSMAAFTLLRPATI